jgi:hypothetical protein
MWASLDTGVSGVLVSSGAELFQGRTVLLTKPGRRSRGVGRGGATGVGKMPVRSVWPVGLGREGIRLVGQQLAWFARR